MVNLTAVLFRRSPFGSKPDPHWRRRQILHLSSHYYGRARNCFSLAIRRVHRALQYVMVGRKLRKSAIIYTWDKRITAATQELGYLPAGSPQFMEALQRTNILLNRQSLSNLAVWEPRTFKALNKFAAAKAHEVGISPQHLGPKPKGVLVPRDYFREEVD